MPQLLRKVANTLQARDNIRSLLIGQVYFGDTEIGDTEIGDMTFLHTGVTNLFVTKVDLTVVTGLLW